MTECSDAPLHFSRIESKAVVADFHGGRCEADDLPDGSGAIFRVWLPKR